MALKNIFQKEKIKSVEDVAYLTLKDELRIERENAKVMREYERKMNRRKVTEAEYSTKMRSEENVVEFDDLHTYFFTDVGTVKAVNGVSFDVPKGKTVGIVGESGCGKSVTSLSLMQLVHAPQGQIVSGEIRYASSQNKCYNIAKMPRDKMLNIRGREISMIFQEPMTSLNPVFTIGDQMDEITLMHEAGATIETAKNRSLEMLRLVGIAMVDKVYASYPHELSGGMRQRVMIAMALSCNPRLIIADEPTTALDVTIQAQILDLLREIKHKINGSIMLITHDLGVIAEMADLVVVMYAGRIVEKGTVEDIFYHPKHPYTVGLMRSKPSMNKKTETLYSIPGQVPNPINMPDHCYFLNRCEHCLERCREEYPPLIQFSDMHFASCYLYEKDKEKEVFKSFAGNGEEQQKWQK
jgi:peptide/nickel transport system ATP-binding protein